MYDLPWDVILIVAGSVWYGISMLILLILLNEPEYRRRSFDCRCGMDWHHRCPDPECECECHDY